MSSEGECSFDLYFLEDDFDRFVKCIQIIRGVLGGSWEGLGRVLGVIFGVVGRSLALLGGSCGLWVGPWGSWRGLGGS